MEYEPRCIVCGSRLDAGAICSPKAIANEVCSDECYDIYMGDDESGDDEHEKEEG